MRSFLLLLCFVAASFAVDHFDSDVTTIGTFKAHNGSFGYQLEVGTADAFNRPELSFHATNDADPSDAQGSYTGKGGVLHLGQCTADGFPFNIISEGETIWGQNEFGGALNGSDFALCRLKPGRLQLRQSVGGVQEDILRVDPSKLLWRDKFLVEDETTTVSNLLVVEGDGTHILNLPKDDTSIHLMDNSLGRIAIQVDGETRYIPYFA